MARKRLVSPEFFRHGELYDAEVASGLPLRIAFIGLWTVADRRGYFTWSPRELKVQVLPHDNVDFSAVLDALAQYGFIAPYVVSRRRYARIPSFARWQSFHIHERPSDLPEPPEPGADTVPTPDQHGASTSVTVTVTAPSSVTALRSQEGARLVVSTGKRPAPSAEVRDAVNKCLPVVAESAHDALAELLESVPSAATWGGIIWGYATTIDGRAASPSRLGEAIQDFVAGGHHRTRPTAKFFRGFVRSAKGTPQPGDSRTGEDMQCEELRHLREQNLRYQAQGQKLRPEPTWAAQLDAKFPDGRTRPALRAS